jgi:hypothetical protein
MAAKIIYGLVQSNGDALEGTGFQSSRVSKGVYTIDFTQDFSNIPSVQVIPVGDNDSTWNIKNPFIKTPNSGQCIVYFYNTSSPPTLKDSKFSFIAIGEE